MANKPDKIEKYLSEYAGIKEQCEDFARTIESIVQSILQEKGVRYQSVTHRVKGEESLRGKLSGPGAPNIKKSVREIQDLVGCRVVFYLEKDREEALKHLENELNGSVKPRPPNPGGYESPHLIVKLDKDRLRLGEYKRFKRAKLKCEIQFTTVLDHAWAELQHDVIYKPDKSLRESGNFDILQTLFSMVKESYLVQAQEVFDMIYENIDGLTGAGPSPGLPIILKLADIATTNKYIYTTLRLLEYYLEQHSSHDPLEPTIIEAMNDMVNRSKTLKPAFEYGLPVGYEQTAELYLRILENTKYVYPNEVFKVLKELSVNGNLTIQEKSLDIVSKMAKYTISSDERKIYYQVQIFFLNEIEAWNEKELKIYLSLATKVAQELLSPSFEGMSYDGGTKAYLLLGALPADDTVKRIRLRTIKILQNLYHFSKTVAEKQLVLDAFHTAMVRSNVPGQGDKDELDTIILENVNSIISFYSSFVESAEFEIVQTVKKQLNLCLIWFKTGLEGVETLQSLIAENTEYQIYEVLVGWNIDFSPERRWDNAGRVRAQKIDEYVEQITNSNSQRWRNRILSIIKNYEPEKAPEFEHLRLFLEKLGEQHHTIAKQLVTEFEVEFRHFLINLLLGIWRSGQTRWVIDLLKIWIEEGKHLSDSAFLFKYIQEADIQLLNAIYRKAEELKDKNAFINIIASVIANHALHQAGKGLFIDCVKKLTELEYASWLDLGVFITESPIWKTLTEDDWKVILENQIISPNINYYMECILVKHAKEAPHLVIDFFRQRANKSEKQGYSISYNAIPVTMQSYLSEAFEKNAEPIIRDILRWLEDDLNNMIISFIAAKLLKDIFPHFHSELERQLIEIVNSGQENRIAVVFRVLNAYHGEKFLHDICKAIIKKYPGNEEYEQALFSILAEESTRGISPPFERVFLEYYEKDKANIQSWKKDTDPAILDFVSRYEKYLDKLIAREKERNYNQPPEENDPPIT